MTRACLDGARRLRSAAEITELIADTVQRAPLHAGAAGAELRDGSQRGSAMPRRVLADVSEGIRSTAERDAKRLLRAQQPARAVVERRGARPRQRPTCSGYRDAWFDEVALTWEINSYAWHLLPQYYANEVKRTAGLTAGGRVVFPCFRRPCATTRAADAWPELDRRPTRRPNVVPVLRSLRSAAGSASARPQ